MSLLDLTAATSRHLVRWALRATIAIIGLCLAIALGFTLYAVSALPPLQPWHRDILHEEFSALRHGTLDFDGYLQLEDRLFDELRVRSASWATNDEMYLHSRFNPDGMPRRLADGAKYNRSFRLSVAQPVGAALLIHGLTDSPYSMKALAEDIKERGRRRLATEGSASH